MAEFDEKTIKIFFMIFMKISFVVNSGEDQLNEPTQVDAASAPMPPFLLQLGPERSDAFKLTPFLTDQLDHIVKFIHDKCIGRYYWGIRNCHETCPNKEGTCFSNGIKCRGQAFENSCTCLCETQDAEAPQIVYKPLKQAWTEWLLREKPVQVDESCFDDYACDRDCPFKSKGKCFDWRCFCESKDTIHGVLFPLSTALAIWRDPCDPTITLGTELCGAACPCGMTTGLCLNPRGNGHGNYCFCHQVDPKGGDNKIVRLKQTKRECACTARQLADLGLLELEYCCQNCNSGLPSFAELQPPTYFPSETNGPNSPADGHDPRNGDGKVDGSPDIPIKV